jgi:tetratricopeptide (TPR) repeat protein
MLRIEQACFRYESSWRAGDRPRIEDFTNSVTGNEQAELLAELLRLDLHYLLSLDEVPELAQYEARFPDHVSLIRALFDERPETASTIARVDVGCANALVGSGQHASTRQPAHTGATMGDPNRTLAYQDPSSEQPKARKDRKRWLPMVPGYEILGELGRGGMGVVFKARHRTLKRLTAVKMILSGEYATATELARFHTEATSIASVKHPNIVQIFEIGEAQGRPFLALEYVEGGRLDHRTRGAPQAPRVAAHLVALLARATHVAHLRGVIHRDIKPSNVLLSLKDDPPVGDDGMVIEPSLEAYDPKLADFGLAFCLGSEGDSSKTGDVLGTPSYMAPEQAEGRLKGIGAPTDVYGLSAILYELLTGRPPFKGTTRAETIEQVRTREPVRPLELQPKVPRDLEIICLKGLRKESAKRYATAQELADDLQRWLDGRPILARPVPVWERVAKWVRRRPAQAVAAAATLFAMLAFTTGGVFYGLYERQQMIGHRRHIDHIRAVDQKLRDAQRAELEHAQRLYSEAQQIIEEDPAAADESTRKQVTEGAERVRQRLAAQSARAQFDASRKKFAPHRDELFFQALKFRQENAADQREVVRREASAAFREFGVNADDPRNLASVLTPFRDVVDRPDLVLVAGEFLEVLVAWADAELEAPALALDLLDAATSLARENGLPPSRALAQRRANCLSLLAGRDAEAGAERERERALPRISALDHFEAALDSYLAGDIGKALPFCEEALQLQPHHFGAHYLKVLCHMREKRWGEAEVGLLVCLGERPGERWLLPLLGMVHGNLKQFQRAENDFSAALKASPDPSFRAEVLTSRSAVRLLQGRRDAEVDLRAAIALQPEAFQGYVNLATLLEHRGDLNGAMEQLDRALRLREDAALFYLRGVLHARTGDLKNARTDFEQVLQVLAKEPGGETTDRAVAARIELAHLRLLAGERDAALAECDAVLAIRPNFPEAHRERAEILLALDKHRDAEAELERYLAVGGKQTPEVFRSLGLLAAQRRDYRKAVDAYSAALRSSREAGIRAERTSGTITRLLQKLRRQLYEAEILSERGSAYLMQDAVQPALGDFDAALTCDPTHADALCGRGTALTLRGRASDMTEATTLAEKSLVSGKRSVPRLMACARIYARAAGVLEKEPRRSANDPEVIRCEQKALSLLAEALAAVPENEPHSVREAMLRDPVLQRLQTTRGWLALATMYRR